MLTHGELFAGISGFGLGLGGAGIETLWHVENDPHCQEVLRRHYPDTLLLSDVRECGKHNLLPVDIISFGSPCQDVSVAGKREGLQGERSGLFFQAIRIVGELKPAFAVFENVPGLFTSHAGRDFAAVLTAFRECGARDIAWRVLDAQYFGVAQRRRRVFVVADFRGERAAEVLFESTRCGWNPEKSRKKGQRTAASAPRGIDVRNSREQPNGVSGTLQSKKTGGYSLNYQNPIAFNHQSGGDVRMGIGEIPTALQANQTIAVAFGGNNTSGEINTATACNAKGGSGRMDFESETFAVVSKGNGEAWLSNTHTSLSSSGGGEAGQGYPAALTGAGVRRLMPVECERLQGFPDRWTEGQSDSERYRQLGNAVCVKVTEWIGKRIVRAVEKGKGKGNGNS